MDTNYDLFVYHDFTDTLNNGPPPLDADGALFGDQFAGTQGRCGRRARSRL
jgi:hypothetical protein